MKSFRKELIRSITHSFSRFWAIFAIVALGAGFFAGLRSSAPDMRATGDAYYDDGNMMDIHVLSSLGLTDSDVDALKAVKGVQAVEPAYSADIISKLAGMDQVIRVHSIPSGGPNSASMNRPQLTSGRWPQNPGECVVGVKRANQSLVKVGDTVQVSTQNGSQSDMLKYGTFKIVGIVSSSYYISFNLGTTDIGNGELNYYMYVRKEDFDSSVYTDLYATVQGAAEQNSFSDQYDNTVQPVVDAVKNISASREDARYNDIYSEAKKKLDDGRTEYDKNKAEADRKLADAAKKISDGEKSIAENEKKLNDSDKQTAEGETALAQGQQTLNQQSVQLQAAQVQIDDAQKQLDAAAQQWKQGTAQLNAEKTKTQAQLQQAESLIGSGIPGTPATRQEFEQMKAAAEQKLAAAQQQLDTAKAKLDAGTAQLNQKKAQIDAGRVQLEAGQKQLTANRAKLVSARAQIASGRKELEKAKADLAEGKTEYDKNKAEADQKLADAAKKISDGQADLDKLKKPKWYVLKRDTNPGFVSFRGDADRMDSIATVFPFLFFMVAALVALTTMTRMVEEERILIGTYKALGFSNAKIASKYLIYAALASIFGSIAGIAVGMVILPQVVWKAYSILYSAPALQMQPNLNYAMIAMLASVGLTLLATYASCRAELAEAPANLMLPRAPKAGKRILLERIKPLWSHMNFTQKVTARNLFRYKKRFFMTVIGIAGCTSLLLTGFGLKDSISQILTKQFNEIDRYNATVGLKNHEIKPGLAALLNDRNNFSNWMQASAKNADVTVAGKTTSATLFVPEKADQLKTFIDLRDRTSHADVPFGKDSVVLTEKLANQLGVRAGDSIKLKSGDDAEVSLKVTGITENYVYHYVYVDPVLYRSKTGATPEYNEVETILADGVKTPQQTLTSKIMAQEGVGTFTQTQDLTNRYGNMIQSVNLVVVVLIISAGLLAFIVLYNLTNINVTERQRELATIKVLGFFDNEVSSYIYREIFLLTVIGCIVGLGFGILMHSFVVLTAEVDFIMFGRTIEPLSYVYSAAMTLLFSWIVNLVMKRKLKKIDMVESLKSVD